MTLIIICLLFLLSRDRKELSQTRKQLAESTKKVHQLESLLAGTQANTVRFLHYPHLQHPSNHPHETLKGTRYLGGLRGAGSYPNLVLAGDVDMEGNLDRKHRRHEGCFVVEENRPKWNPGTRTGRF